MRKIIFHPDTLIEVKNSYNWYQEQTQGLGDDLLLELESAYQAITEMPDTWPKFGKNYQRFLLSTFPFSVIYCNNNNALFVVAIMHNSRKPKYWNKRKP